MSDILNYAKSVVGKLVDFDGVYGGQCADLSTAAVWDVLGIHLSGNAIDAGSADNMANMKANTCGYKVEKINNSTTFIPAAGDILVESSDDNPFGHISIVVSATSNTMDVIEQNYTGTGYVPSPNGVERRTRSYLQYVNYAIRITKENENNKGDEDMKIISITTDGDYYGKKYKKGACFLLTGDSIRYIERPLGLDSLKKVGIGFYSITAIQFLSIIQDLNLKIS